MTLPDAEPDIRVGLLQRQSRVEVSLPGGFLDADGNQVPPGDYVFERDGHGVAATTGPRSLRGYTIALSPSPDSAPFVLSSRVGADFHWSEAERLAFAGALRVEPDGDGLRAINAVALETYLAAVVASEMSARCPDALIRAHSVIARSWQLAQRAARDAGVASSAPWQENAEGLRWYDQSAHADFDVCAEDHCQRYHGVGRIATDTVRAAVAATRGEVLSFAGAVCDTRYSKSCGGVVEDARVAWGDEAVPYLSSFFDGEAADGESFDLSGEARFAAFLDESPDAFCRCDDADILDLILPERDRRTTPDFFRWEERVSAEELSARVAARLDSPVGRVVGLVPMARGRSGRLYKLRIEGERGAAVVGKELEIRRVLSRSHLKSSAFVVRTEGPAERPDVFVLRGAGWGHGAGLCQIGAAVMAVRGYDYQRILMHYYPQTALKRLY
ncbi:MAG: SpoIID/LytB domain-containing protein [Pseudomonadota bacterium]